MGLVQISRLEGSVDRVPRGTTPVVELELEPHQYVVSVDLRGPHTHFDDPDRETIDWRWTAYVATQLEAPRG